MSTSPSPSPSTSTSAPATTTLSNSVKVPLIGFGCCYGNWTVWDGSRAIGLFPEQSYRGFASALRAGFRHFDGAFIYGTEKHLGYSLAPHFAEGKIKREDLFLTSKYGHPGIPGNALYTASGLTCHPSTSDVRTKIMSHFDKTCENLGVGSLDLALVHWPNAFDSQDEKLGRRHRLAVWSTFEELYNLKQIRAIGVANFSQKHIEQLIEDGCKIVPMVNQLELHPYCQQPALVEFCRSKGIALQAYSPLGSVAGSGSGAINLFIDPVLTGIAASHNRTVSQIILRWLVQQNIIALPRSSSFQHCQENFDIFTFQLTSTEMEQIQKLDINKHTSPDPANIV